MSRIKIGLLAGIALAAVMPVAAQAADPVGKFDGATLSLSRWAGDPWTAAQVKSAAAWSAATGGKLTVDAIPYENLHDKQVLEMSNGTYDIMYVHPSWFGEYVSAGALLPIDDLLADASANPPGFSKDDYLPSVLSQGASGGKQYCLPDFVASVVVAYRKDLFDAAGLAAPKTLDDVLADAAKLNKDGVAGITLPGKKTGATADVLGSLLTAYGTWWYDKNGKSALDVDAATKAIDFYVKASKFAPQGILNYHFDEVATAAAQGQAAMAISTTVSLSWVEDPAKSKTVGKWAYAPLAVTADKPSGELIYWNWCINAASKNPKAAYSFLQYWTSAAQQGAVAKVAATAGATKQFYEDKDLVASLPFLPALQGALQNANAQPSLANWSKVQDEIELAVQGAIEGKTSPADTAKGIRAMLDKELGG
ncbi:MAG TPA: extracellular solute-binding protein [Bauldia sp.]|nr:extracellular solute-binding protein [Bauldia sp.]